MTRARRRRFRLVFESDAARPWIIQYDDGPQAWKDTYRFRQYGEAVRYLADVTARDHALAETYR